MHHKRRRPKNRRGGCLMCKSHKMNGAGKNRRAAERRRLDAAKEEPNGQ